MSRVVGCVVTRSHIASVRAMARRLAETTPGAVCIGLIVDAEPGEIAADEPFIPWTLQDLTAGDPQLERDVLEMTFCYTAFELCCAVRGLFHRAIHRRGDWESWLVIDGDVWIVGDLTPVFEEVELRSISLSAHAATPAYPDTRPQPELEFLSSGIYNGGVLGLRRDDESLRFAEWFHQRLRRHAIQAAPMFVDQLWLNLVPGWFSSVGTFEHRGVNVGHWNLHERPLERVDDTICVGDEPLLLAHLSAVDRGRPKNVSRHAPWFDGEAPEPWGALVEQYFAALDSAGHAAASATTYRFDRYHSGGRIALGDRRTRRAALLADRAVSADPFARRPSFWARMRLAIELRARALGRIERFAD